MLRGPFLFSQRSGGRAWGLLAELGDPEAGPLNSSLAVPQLGLRLPACPKRCLGLRRQQLLCCLSFCSGALAPVLCMLLCAITCIEDLCLLCLLCLMLWRR